MSTSSFAAKPEPFTATTVRGGPLAGEIVIPRVTVKFVELVPVPPALVTEIGPVEARAGTVVLSWVVETNVQLAFTPLNFTVVDVQVEPDPVKPVPVMVTGVPTGPLAGENPETVGAAARAAGASTPTRTPATRITATRARNRVRR